MKKKIIYFFGIAFCLIAVMTALQNETIEKKSVVLEKRTLPKLQAGEILNADALTEEASLTGMIDDTEASEKVAEYLSYYFDISLEDIGFYAALDKLCEKNTEETGEAETEEIETEESETEEIETEETKTEEIETETEEESEIRTEKEAGADMIKAAVISAGKEPLALTYSEDKIEERLQFYGINDTPDKRYSRYKEYNYLVCALDLGMIDEKTAQNAIGGTLSLEEQQNLLMAAANVMGKGRNYLGYSNDKDIYAKLGSLYALYAPFAEESFEDIKDALSAENEIKNCVLKKTEYDARFLPDLTVWYSHTSLEHMQQLLGLLNSENMVAKVQLEPKMILWNEKTEKPEKTEEGETAGAGILQYDLVLEFEEEEDIRFFAEIVNEYIRTEETDKNRLTDSEEELLYFTEGKAAGEVFNNTKEIEEITVETKDARLSIYTLTEQAQSIKEKIAELIKEKGTEGQEQETETQTDETEEEQLIETELRLNGTKRICNEEYFIGLGGGE